MKFCPVVPEICREQVHGPRKERKKEKEENNNNNNNNNNNKKRCLGDLIIGPLVYYLFFQKYMKR